MAVRLVELQAVAVELDLVAPSRSDGRGGLQHRLTRENEFERGHGADMGRRNRHSRSTRRLVEAVARQPEQCCSAIIYSRPDSGPRSLDTCPGLKAGAFFRAGETVIRRQRCSVGTPEKRQLPERLAAARRR